MLQNFLPQLIMRLNLLLLPLTGIVPVTLSIVPHKYHLIMTPMTWSGAQNYCKETYADLAVIQNAADWLRIKAEADRQQMISPAWIGLYNDLDNWRWSYNNLPLKDITLRMWQSGEPSNGSQSCGAISYTGDWADYSCTDIKSFICYDSRAPAFAKYISYTLPPLNWFAAQGYCKTIHTDLATASNSLDNTDIKNRVLFLNNAWFGLFRDTWTWADGAVASNIPWKIAQPDLQGLPNCATYAGGLISDETCSGAYAFFCHSIPPVKQRQIMSLQVKSDASLFDPHMASLILEQIKQKLSEKGMAMENITVAWKKSQDGTIFKNKDDL